MTDRSPVPTEFEHKLRAAAQAPAPRPEFVTRLRRELGSQPPLRLPWYTTYRPALGQAARMALFLLLALGLVLSLNLLLRGLLPGLSTAGEQTPTVEFSPTPAVEEPTPEPQPDETGDSGPVVEPAPASPYAFMDWAGVVENVPSARYLPEPVTLEREGISMTILSLVADQNQTVLVYEVEGLSISLSNSQGEGAQTGSGSAILVLPDGSRLDTIDGSGTGWGTGHRSRFVYQALPVDVNEVTVLVPWLQSMPRGTAPEDWEIPLTLSPIPDSYRSPQPVIRVGQKIETVPGLTAVLDWVVIQPEGYLMTIGIDWDLAEFPKGVNPGQLEIIDAAGVPVPAMQINTFAPRSTGPNHVEWSYQVGAPSVAGPLAIRMPDLHGWDEQKIVFPLDFGPEPYDGQHIDINEVYTIGLDRVEVISVDVIIPPDGPELVFKLRADPEKFDIGAGLDHPDYPAAYASGASGTMPADIFTRTVGYPDGLPSGMQQGYAIVRFRENRGALEFVWEPPVEVAVVQPPSQTACLTLEDWRQMDEDAPQPVPAELSGLLLLYEKLPGSQEYGMILSTLDGVDQRVLGPGVWSALAPDGSQVVYSGQTGLMLRDLASGREITLAPDGYSPVWSPDSKRIAFTRQATEFDIWVVNADGTGLRQLTNTLEYEMPKDWTMDGARILYTLERTGGLQWLEAIHPETGEVEKVMQLHGGKSFTPALSPDGNWIAYEGRVFGEMYSGIYLARLDGTEERLLVSLKEVSVFHPVWSPDGRWLLLSTGEFFPETGEEKKIPFLLNIATCQVIRLNVSGEVNSWSW